VLPDLPYNKFIKQTSPMKNLFTLQIRWNREGTWENTVFAPLPYAEAFGLWKDHQKSCPEHMYRILLTGVAKA